MGITTSYLISIAFSPLERKQYQDLNLQDFVHIKNRPLHTVYHGLWHISLQLAHALK